eukprot:m.940320 g.940320  ORF g.940320 m.940320 type:complete len:956 (+) comp23827_c0_seq6:2237-5104(+)
MMCEQDRAKGHIDAPPSRESSAASDDLDAHAAVPVVSETVSAPGPTPPPSTAPSIEAVPALGVGRIAGTTVGEAQAVSTAVTSDTIADVDDDTPRMASPTPGNVDTLTIRPYPLMPESPRKETSPPSIVRSSEHLSAPKSPRGDKPRTREGSVASFAAQVQEPREGKMTALPTIATSSLTISSAMDAGAPLNIGEEDVDRDPDALKHAPMRHARVQPEAPPSPPTKHLHLPGDDATRSHSPPQPHAQRRRGSETVFSRSPGHETQLLGRRLSQKLVQQLRELPLQMDDDDDGLANSDAGVAGTPDVYTSPLPAAAMPTGTIAPRGNTASPRGNTASEGEHPLSGRPVSQSSQQDAHGAVETGARPLRASASPDPNDTMSQEDTPTEGTNSQEVLPGQLQDALLLSDVETFEQLRATFLRAENVRSSYIITTSMESSTSSTVPQPQTAPPASYEHPDATHQPKVDPAPSETRGSATGATQPRDHVSTPSPVHTSPSPSQSPPQDTCHARTDAAESTGGETIPLRDSFSFVKHPNWEPVRQALHDRLEFVRTLQKEKEKQWASARASMLQAARTVLNGDAAIGEADSAPTPPRNASPTHQHRQDAGASTSRDRNTNGATSVLPGGERSVAQPAHQNTEEVHRGAEGAEGSPLKDAVNNHRRSAAEVTETTGIGDANTNAGVGAPLPHSDAAALNNGACFEIPLTEDGTDDAAARARQKRLLQARQRQRQATLQHTRAQRRVESAQVPPRVANGEVGVASVPTAQPQMPASYEDSMPAGSTGPGTDPPFIDPDTPIDTSTRKHSDDLEVPGRSVAPVIAVKKQQHRAGITDKDGRRSNRSLVRNAITHTCLAGPVNEKAKTGVLAALDESLSAHFVMLLHDKNDLKFRALYAYNLDTGEGFKLCGRGPSRFREDKVIHTFRYDSGSRKFVITRTSNVITSMIDAFCMATRTKKKPAVI